ncbi:hypothetical protein ACEWY4_011357 [Coilia grayii]|uniref:Sorting nexin-2 n=1 Tax=Coilia grayii TaxID=363190 RepID=A0ABD1K4I1_9TELE
MATSSDRTPPPFPDIEDMDIETEIRGVESNEHEYILAIENVTGADVDEDNNPGDTFPPVYTVSNPISGFLDNADNEGIYKPVEEPADLGPKDEPNGAPENIFLTPQNTAVSNPQETNLPTDHSESLMHIPDGSSATDFEMELSPELSDEMELMTDLDITDELHQDDNSITGELVSDSQDIPVTHVAHEPESIVSEPLGILNSMCSKELVSDITEQPAGDDLLELLSEPARTEQKDLFGDPPDDIFSEVLQGKDEQQNFGISAASEEDYPEAKTTPIAEPLTDNVDSSSSEDFPEDPVMRLVSPETNPPDDLFSEMLKSKDEQQNTAISAASQDICLEAKNALITEPLTDDMDDSSESVSDSQNIPVTHVLHEPESTVSVSLVDSVMCAKEPLSDITERSVSDDLSEWLSEPASTEQEDLFGDPPDDTFSQIFEGKDEQQNSAISAASKDVCLETNNTPITEPSTDDLDTFAEEPSINLANQDANQPDEIFSEVFEGKDEQQKSAISTSSKDDVPEAKTPLITEPLTVDVDDSGALVSDCHNIPVTHALREPESTVSEPLGVLNSMVCAKEPASDVTEQPAGDDLSELISEPARREQKDLFGDPPDDIFSDFIKGKNEQQKSAISAVSKDAKHTTIVEPLTDDVNSFPSDDLPEDSEVRLTSPGANPSCSSDCRTRDGEEQDIFAEATVELSLDSPAIQRGKEEPSGVLPPASSTSASSSISKLQSKTLEELEEEETADRFDINVLVTNPEKVGDGMNAYMVYRVSTKTSLPMFKSKNLVVRRRFSDFLGLYEKLSDKLSQNGYIVPPPPEKSILGMTKVKVGKEDASSAEFVEKRRAALERFIQRILCYPTLLQDPSVREFLESEELPRAVNTQTFSGAGFLKIIHRATDAVSKMTIKMNESDIWFEEKLQEVEAEDHQLRRLHALVDSLVIHRKDLSGHTAMFAKSVGMLGSSEDNTALSRALCQLAEVEDKIEQLHQQQAGNDFFIFAELLADYIRLLEAVRGCFDQRMKMWQRWQDAQNMLQKKREMEAKLLWANKPDKLQLAKDEIAEWEEKVTQYERDFERISETVRKEVLRFEKEKAKDFKKQMLKYLQALLHSQQQLIKYWEAFLPEAKAIA